MERRLTTILAADIAGYARLMAADEEAVVDRLKALRTRVIDPAVNERGGRIVKTMGDGLLIEFASPVEAVRAAIAVQVATNAAEAAMPEDQRMLFRIGVHFGDVMVDGDDLLGDVVNVAARLETLSPVGGLCVSRAVREMIEGKVAADLTDIGPQRVKNIPEPVDVWRVEVAGAVAPAEKPRTPSPSIAVLPFTSRSPDPDDAFLADGIVEDVTNELSRFRALTVIARASARGYQADDRDIPAIGRALGARYLVEGSVRRAGERLRVTAQLIDAETGVQIWSDRWDRLTADLFDLQDELTSAIVTAVEPELGAHERTLARRKPTDSLTAWELCQRGYAAFGDYSTESMDAAATLLKRSVTADPEFALPRALLSRVSNVRIASGRSDDPGADIAEGLRWADEALTIDDRLEMAHLSRAIILAIKGESEAALASINSALALNSNHPGCHHGMTLVQLFSPEPDAELMTKHAKTALQLSPKDPTAHAMQFALANGFLFRNYDFADPDFGAAILAASRYPRADYYVFLQAATAMIAQSRDDEARSLIAEALKRRPDMTMAKYWAVLRFPIKDRLFRINEENGNSERMIALGLPRD